MPSPLAVASRGLFVRDLLLDDLGVWRGSLLVAWDEIEHYLYDWQDWRRPGDILLVDMRDRVCRIAPVLHHWQVAAERVFGELHPRLRSRPRFDPFVVEADALVHVTKGRLPFADIDTIEIASVGRDVRAVVHGVAAGPWAEADASRIVDFWLWLETLARRGVAIRSNLPLPLLRLRDAELPLARALSR
jgi:hypothetical protein